MQATLEMDDRARRAVLLLLSGVVFLSVINASMINVALPMIGRAFGVTEGTYGWLVTGNSLAFGIFNAIHGRLADNVGLRRLYLLGLVVLGATSILLAMAPNIEVAIGLRVLQGAGSAAMPALGTTIIARLFAPSRRGAAMGTIMGITGIAASIGPFLGGVLVQLAGWRAVMGFTAVALLLVPLGMRLLPAQLDQKEARSFDILGALLMGAGTSALMYSFHLLERGGLDVAFAACVAAGLALLGLFAWRIRVAEEPFAPPALFGHKRFMTAAAVAFLSNGTRFGTIVLVPILLIEVHQMAPAMVGTVLLPGALLVAVGSPLAGRLADRLGSRLPAMAGMVLIVLGNLVTARFAGISATGVGAGMGLYGLGFALVQSPMVSLASQMLPREHTSVGMGTFMMIFFLGGGFGVALSVTAVELQGRAAPSWVGLVLGAGGPFSNAILTLTALAVVGWGLLWLLPGRTDLAPGEDPRAAGG